MKSGITLAYRRKAEKVGILQWPAAAIFDMAIKSFVAGWRESTSVIFHVQLPINKNIERNPLNTILQTGLYARYTGLFSGP